ncbi:TPA: type II secretion system secretin GspD [Pseudomonas putida]|jgi:general secretion pathway protein D|uniref:Type II secretion system secretin GspD n=1 Tax=Pseudomonas putida TaxID=303 RepID=A0AAW6PX69_PSEPU|nr:MULTISPECIES: type II secretion system secretin GspD [Pseudomonas]MDN5674257.1 type II secretion system secretin GspD [Pseudomonas sp.]EKT4461454.1 type II secretion system secretin GspD [Pseudomonas putida]EKT4554509.1 type II secretion system secretin GspD [Pseudomonas putida]ELF6206362.1 type II secretion system secretin GspD [Pseudomonas putida]MBH3350913.1 type II secretion system secretin GspD [Pseudomonas putida]
MPVRYCVAAVLSLALAIGLPEARAEEPVFDENGTPMYEVNFVDTELGEFIDSVSRITGTTFIVDPRVKGKVTVRTVDLHDADAIYDIFLAQLRAQGYATVDLPNGSVKIVPDQAARLEPVPVEAGGQQGEGSDSVATRVFNVRNAASEQVLGILKPLIDPRVGVITPYPAAHQLVVTDWRSNLDRIASLLRQLDRPQEAPGNGSTQVIYLRHANAGEVVKVLRGLSQEGMAPAEGTGEGEGKDRPVMAAAGGPGIRLEYEEGTNAVVMVGPDSELAAYRAIVEQLDIRRAQVVVEAIIAEVSDSSAQELGVQWLFADEKFGAGIVNFGSNGVNIANIAGAAASGDNEALGDLLSATTGATAGIGHFGGGFNFAMLVNALKGKSGFNLLSTPTLLTLDNAEASILVGQEVPFVTGSVTQNNANPYQTIERKEVGVKLRIKPQINIDNSVRLDIVQEVSSIAESSAASDVITNKREIKTKVMVEDNGLVILGGLISDELSTSNQRVPLLGDIPYLGRLFRSDATRNTKQNLMVFIRPRILRDGPSLAGLSEDKYRTLQQTTPLQLPDLAEGTPLLQVFPSSRARLEGGAW